MEGAVGAACYTQPMTPRADIEVLDKDGRVAAVVEVKARRDTTAAWPAELRRNLLAHGVIPRTEFFILATPERIHLWRHALHEDPARAPDFVASAESLLGEYLRSAQIEIGNLRGSTLELVVVQWLVDVARGRAGSRNEPLVRDSGLGDAIADGVVEVPTAA